MEQGDNIGVASIQQITQLVARIHEPQLFWLKECVIAYVESRGNVQGFPSVSSAIVALEAMQVRLQELKDLIILLIEQDIDKTISLTVQVNSMVHPPKDQELLQQNSIARITQIANKAESDAVESVRDVLDSQIERVSGLLDQIKSLIVPKVR